MLDLLIAAGAMVGGFVQGLAGFGFGLAALSIWAWALEPTLIAPLGVFGALTGQLIAAFTLRRRWDLPTLAPYLLGGLAGVPVGTWLLPSLDSDLFRFGTGLFLVVWCPAMLFAARLPRVTRGGRVADGIVGIVGGVMGGLGGFTGTIPTLWCLLRAMPKDAQRQLIQNFNLSMLAVAMASHIAGGLARADMLPQFAIVAAAVWLPVRFGARLYTGISEVVFRRIVLYLLTGSGLTLLAASAPRVLVRVFATIGG